MTQMPHSAASHTHTIHVRKKDNPVRKLNFHYLKDKCVPAASISRPQSQIQLFTMATRAADFLI